MFNYALLDLHKPDIVIGTESWLHKDILDFLGFSHHTLGTTPIRRDKSTDAKGGGVFILVSEKLVVSAQPQLCFRGALP